VGTASQDLDAARAARNQAKRRLDSRVALAREDLAPGAIAGRAADDLKRMAQDTLDEAVEIADGNRTVVAGTIAALLLWLLRKPILSLIDDGLRRARKIKGFKDE
jgi:hypothetical protein